MLENTRRQGASIFVYLIFCLLIAIFVINFGPQGGSRGGCSGSSNVILSVNGKETTQAAYHIAYANPYNRGNGKQKTYVALETLIRRELLAQAAEEQGLRANSDLVQNEIKKGHFFLGGQRAQIPGIFDENGYWNIKAFNNWYRQMNVSRNSYVGEQERGLLASMMSQILQDSVQVSRDEALQHFLFENNTVQYDVVAFKPESYRAAMKLTDADIERFVATHGKEVEERYKADERTYKAVKPQLQLRQIFIAKLEDDKPAEKPADATPAPEAGSAAGSGSAAAPKTDEKKDEKKDAKKDEKKDDKKVAEAKKIGMPIEDAKKKLEVARADIEAKKLKFADAAKTLNTDETMKNSGGDLGWRTADNAMLGDKAVSDAVKTLQPGQMTPVITTDKGVYLLIAEGKREGDLTFDQVKHEIAKELARDVWSKEAAKRAAIAALEKARSGTGQNLDQLYEKEAPSGGGGVDIQQILNDPNLTQEQKQQILQMLLQQQQGGGAPKSGALEPIVVEGKDVPAAWYAQADGAGSAPAGSAAPAPAPAPAPAAGSAAPAAGSAAPATPAATPAPAAPVETEVVASADQLPELDAVKAPNVQRFGPSPRATTMSGLGTSKAAINALFDELTPGMLAKHVYEADGNYVILQLITRTQPKVEDFEKDADRLVEELRQQRAQAFVEEWLSERCKKLVDDKKIKPNPQLIQEFDDAGKPLPVSYRPCMSFH